MHKTAHNVFEDVTPGHFHRIVGACTRALLGAHIRGSTTDRESASLEEVCELEDSSWLAVKPGENEGLAPHVKLSREHNQCPDSSRVDEATVLKAEDNVAFCAAN